ncbi:MAG TPA: hypothetical protein VEV19_09095, partial [Ktedonobacteraceae bacterium]|nr:hypothetical protein [Ktedonobacteraceae bacterium]
MNYREKNTPLSQELSEEVANPTNEHQDFTERLQHALNDEHMHTALSKFAPSWRASRAAVFSTEVEDYGPDYSFVNMRAMLRDSKDYAIEHQPELIAQFK